MTRETAKQTADELALTQGWFLADESENGRGYEIQRDDDSDAFEDDDHARDFVHMRARGGDALAIAALHAVRHNSRKRWDTFAQGTDGPHCGHSVCSQHYVDSGRVDCVDERYGDWEERNT